MGMSAEETQRAGLPEDAAKSAQPQHRVVIPRAFAIGRYEVTFAEWEACVEDGECRRRDDAGWGRDNRPILHLTWGNAWKFTRWLSKRTGHDYRLPSEAEWEYAARAGGEPESPWGSDLDKACAFANVHDTASSSAYDELIPTARISDSQGIPFLG